MQVVVLAGGVGSRLLPWTNQIPKPLLPMLDKTLLEQVISSVPNEMIDEVIVAGGYKVDVIKSYFSNSEFDFDITIVPEDKPLGTGGALGNCRDVVNGTFACFNGDIISSLNIKSLLNLHKSNGGIGTLGLWEVNDPTRFGIVGLDDNSKITRFKEKPLPEEVFSNLINAGSYIFEDDIFDYIPKRKNSIEREVFPVLAEKEMLNGQKFEGFFIDSGTRSSWCDAVRTCIDNNRFSKGEICGKSWFGKPFGKVEEGSTIIDSMVQRDTEIMHSVIENSTILSGTKISNNVLIESSLIGKNVTIGQNSKITNMIVDHDSIIPENTILNDGQWP
ncbi:MAG: NDP-sugar synthase [Candidatus Poseidoniaceae archaeon]|nr:NDP-sugar synthase [Candidatus Poseidoniaceae archaeon]|tara:strand:+ start:2812 stop:3807 length:996 start_codon:yes stop_codon:yes gene_type:complete